MADSATTLTLYSKPGCVQCTGSVRHLSSKGFKHENGDYVYIDVTTDPEAYDFVVNGLKNLQMPTLVVRDTEGNITDKWTGYDPDKLDEWVKSASLVAA
jgi:glutaredoxin